MMLKAGLRRRWNLIVTSTQQAHATRTDQQSEHDKDDAEDDFATYDCDDAADDKEDREDPQDEVHGRSVPPVMTFKQSCRWVLTLRSAGGNAPAYLPKGDAMPPERRRSPV